MSAPQPTPGASPLRSLMVFLVFLLLVAGAAGLGASFPPGPWYASLAKPPLNPPGWIFAPVWSLLYLSLATAGWLIWRTGPGHQRPLKLWGAQLVCNALWSPLFFGLERPGVALMDIVLLLGLVVLTTLAFCRRHRLAGWLMVPYALWVAFATYLNAGLWILNR